MELGRSSRAAYAAAMAGVVLFVAAVGTATPNSTAAIAPLDDQAAMGAACAARLADPRSLTPAQRTWLNNCRGAFATASTSPSPSISPSPSPSLSPSPSVSPTPSPTPPPATGACPAWPAFPDENCTGWRHTGVVLRSCPTRLDVAGALYDGCRFDGNLIIAAANIRVTRSWVNGGHLEGAGSQTWDMRNVSLTDVEITGPAGSDQYAAIGNNNYSCVRCHIHRGYRGFALGSNVRIVDSYAHDFKVQSGAHQTAASSHGGAHVFIDHSRLRCNSDRYACSNGISFYSEDSPGIDDVLIQRSHISTDAGYGIGFFSLQPGKPHGITNTRILNNTFGSWEYGPRANWPSGQAGNVWAGNVQAPFDPGCRC